MTGEEQPQGWSIYSLAQAYEDRPPTEWIVDKFFSSESLNIVYGPPASMKSMLLADMCAAIAAGRDWLPGCYAGGKGIGTVQSPVFWIDMDNGSRRTHERFAAVGRAHQLPPNTPLFYTSMPMPPFNANDLDSTLYLVDTIREVQARLVVIDNLGLITGDVEENSAEMASVMGYLRIIAERTHSALIVIHHQRKGGANGGRQGDALRGHSSIEAAVDLALHVMRDPDTSSLTIRSTKTRGVDVPDTMAQFNYVHKPNTHDLEKAWFSGMERVRGSNAIREAIVATLAGNVTMTKTRLAEEVRKTLNGEVGVNSIRAWIDDMLNVSGELTSSKGRDNATVISLP